MRTASDNCSLSIIICWKSFVTGFLSIIMVVGCASMGGTYPEDKGDMCANQRGDLRRTEDYFLKQGVTNVVGGALIGAASGAIISAIKGGDIGNDAAIGAAAGAGAGLIKTMFESINRENQQIDLATNAFNNLSQCRFNAAEAVRTEFRSGRLSKPVALNKMSDLKIRFNEDVLIANRIGAKMSERSDQFQNNLVKEDPSAALYLAEVKNEQSSSVNSQTIKPTTLEPETNPTDSSTSVKSSKKSSKKDVSRKRSTVQRDTAAKKIAAKSQITSPETAQAADATVTNIVKAKQYKDSVKSAAQKENFQIEGQIGLFLTPDSKKPYQISWLKIQKLQCAAASF